MENHKIISLGDLPISELMHNDEQTEVSFGDLPVDSLTHHGIKGQKWGIRRYQNADGSLTAAGKKRRAKLEAELDKLGGKKSDSDSEPAKPKTVNEMSDAELRDAVNRLNLEKQFRALQNELRPQKVSAGKAYANKLIKNIGDSTAEALRNSSKVFLEKKFKEILGVDDKKTEKPKSEYEKLKEKVEMLDMQKRYKAHQKDTKRQEEFDESELKKKTLANKIAIENMESKIAEKKREEKEAKKKRREYNPEDYEEDDENEDEDE